VAHNEEGPPRCFLQNVPLPQIVDFLVDLWEAEGLDTVPVLFEVRRNLGPELDEKKEFIST
jgi:hypothetical protein